MLSKQRRQIDKLDQEIVALLEARMEVVSEVAKIKAENRMQILDSQREEELLTKIRNYVHNQDYAESIVNLYAEMMVISRAYQQDKNK